MDITSFFLKTNMHNSKTRSSRKWYTWRETFVCCEAWRKGYQVFIIAIIITIGICIVVIILMIFFAWPAQTKQTLKRMIDMLWFCWWPTLYIKCVSSLCKSCIITQDKNAKLLQKIHIFAKIIHTQKAKVFPLCEIVNRRIFE